MTAHHADRWNRALSAVLVTVCAYGAVLVLRADLAARLFDALGFGPGTSATDARGATEHAFFVYGVLGAVIIGWMLLLLAVVRGPLRRRERWAWEAVSVSAAGWFVVDTGFSLAVGSPAHAGFNVLFGLALGVPLVLLRSSCTVQPDDGASSS